MGQKLDIIEMEFQELISLGFSNFRFGLRIKTTPKTWEEDYANLIIEVKTRLQELAMMAKSEHKERLEQR